jgi:peptide/nickel transport system permease protein
MGAYIVRRLFFVVVTMLVTSFLIFAVIRNIPGDIIDVMASRAAVTNQSSIGLNRLAIERELGLDAPFFVQYGRWMGFLPGKDGKFIGIFEGNMGTSLWSHSPVINDIAARWPVTFELGIMAILVANLIGLPIGIFSALRQDTLGDYLTRSFAILCLAIPGFWLGTLVIVFPSIWWNYTPSLTLIKFSVNPIGNLEMFIMPAIVLGMGMAGMTMRMTRTMMLEVLRQDYIRTAWAKGLRERVVIMRHALKNALIPVITVIGGSLSLLVGGTVIIEEIFQLPGMGRLLLDTTLSRDYPEVSSIMLLMGLGIVISNLLVDLTYSYLDPRVRYK